MPFDFSAYPLGPEFSFVRKDFTHTISYRHSPHDPMTSHTFMTATSSPWYVFKLMEEVQGFYLKVKVETLVRKNSTITIQQLWGEATYARHSAEKAVKDFLIQQTTEPRFRFGQPPSEDTMEECPETYEGTSEDTTEETTTD